MNLAHHKNTIKINWFTKPIWSGRYLNNHSEQPKIQKGNNTIRSIQQTVLTRPNDRPPLIKKIIQTLTKNNYHIYHINKIIKERIYKFYNPKKNIIIIHNIKYSPLPYIKGLSESIQSIMKPYNIKIAHRNTNNLSLLFSKIKTTEPTLSTTYQNCEKC